MAYPTRAQLVTASTVAALTGASATDQDGFYAVAKRAVESFTGQTFDLESDVTRVVDGAGGTKLDLPKRLATLDALVISGSALDASGVALNDDNSALYVKPISGVNWVERALIEFDGGGLAFTPGTGTVTITGDWGWTDAELPQSADSAIGIAMRLDMEDQALAKANDLTDTVRAFARAGVEDINQGGIVATIRRPDVPLSPEAQAVLEPYIWTGA